MDPLQGELCVRCHVQPLRQHDKVHERFDASASSDKPKSRRFFLLLRFSKSSTFASRRFRHLDAEVVEESTVSSRLSAATMRILT